MTPPRTCPTTWSSVPSERRGAGDGSGYDAAVEEKRLTSVAGELGLTVDELREAQGRITAGVDEAVLGGLIRFEDALYELSL
jgi:hypothetical protein